MDQKVTLTVLGLLVAATTARADVGVVVAGEATMQPMLVRQLEGWLKKHNHTLVANPMPAEAVNTLTDCFVIEDEGCAKGVIEKRAKAKSIIFARVELQAGGDIDKTVTVTAYWFEGGQKMGSARKFCERCNESSLRATADDVMSQLMKSAPQAVGKLKLTSSPAGASCAIDGKPVSPTPLELDLAPGDHEVVLTRDRHRTEKRKVAVTAGETTALEVAMVAVDGKRSSTLLPVVTIGVGVAMIATGGVLLAIDKDRGPDQPEFIRDTAPWGVGIGLGGVLAVGGGLLWYRATKKSESQPIASVGRAGAVLGWAGSF
jgi:hypothetical protein